MQLATEPTPDRSDAPRRFTRWEYQKMADAGVFGESERVELLDGEVVTMSPEGTRHAAFVRRLIRILAREVADRAEAAYRAGAVPLASAEGFIRQLIGWREYVWGLYWLEPPSYASLNELAATRPLPQAFTGAAETRMECVKACLDGIEERSWLHHIQRLMVLGNLSLLAGVRPQEVTSWMWERFVDGAEWVMVPNVIGMSLYADGGRMATKPYAAGGAYLSRMSTYCKSCTFDHKQRVGENACPFTTLYWDFILRHAERFAGNHRMVRQVRAAEQLSDRSAVRLRATQVLALLDEGRL